MKLAKLGLAVNFSGLAIVFFAKGVDCRNCICTKNSDGTYNCVCEGRDSCK